MRMRSMCARYVGQSHVLFNFKNEICLVRFDAFANRPRQMLKLLIHLGGDGELARVDDLRNFGPKSLVYVLGHEFQRRAKARHVRAISLHDLNRSLIASKCAMFLIPMNSAAL